MKTSAKNLEKCQIEVAVTLDADEVQAVVKTVEKEYVREAQLPGFRKGKVPLALIRKEFATGLKQSTEQELVRKYASDAIKAEGIESVAITGVRDMKMSAEGGEFVLTVEVRPAVKLPTYKGLKIGLNDTTVKDGDVEKQIDSIRVSCADYVDAQEGEAVAAGDFAEITYAGTIDGKGVLEVCPEAKGISEGKGFWIRVEEGAFIPEVVEAVKGMKVGESKADIKVKFAKEGVPEGLKGKKAIYSATLTKFRRRILPDDAKLAEKMKAESYEKLVANIRKSMEERAVSQEAARREDLAAELLLKKVDFDLPESQVREQMEAELGQFAQQAQYSGLDASYFEKNRDQILKDAEELAKKRLRFWYVCDAIVKQEKIEAKPNEIVKKALEFVLANAKQ